MGGLPAHDELRFWQLCGFAKKDASKLNKKRHCVTYEAPLPLPPACRHSRSY
jgi:hypothetical protein